MKKRVLIAAVVLIVVALGCNRKRFESKLEGTWSLSRYLNGPTDETKTMKDTLMNNYKLVIESNQQYMESWLSYNFRADTIITPDTLGYDTLTSSYVVKHDTFAFIDTTITPHADNGTWQLTNSQQDLELLDDSANTARLYYILKLSGSQLNLQNGNYEMDLSK